MSKFFTFGHALSLSIFIFLWKSSCDGLEVAPRHSEKLLRAFACLSTEAPSVCMRCARPGDQTLYVLLQGSAYVMAKVSNDCDRENSSVNSCCISDGNCFATLEDETFMAAVHSRCQNRSSCRYVLGRDEISQFRDRLKSACGVTQGMLVIKHGCVDLSKKVSKEDYADSCEPLQAHIAAPLVGSSTQDSTVLEGYIFWCVVGAGVLSSGAILGWTYCYCTKKHHRHQRDGHDNQYQRHQHSDRMKRKARSRSLRRSRSRSGCFSRRESRVSRVKNTTITYTVYVEPTISPLSSAARISKSLETRKASSTNNIQDNQRLSDVNEVLVK